MSYIIYIQCVYVYQVNENSEYKNECSVLGCLIQNITCRAKYIYIFVKIKKFRNCIPL